MEDQGADVHNFSTSPSQHRLPTVSGTEALQNASTKTKAIPSSLPALDRIFLPNGPSLATPGIPRGCVTEVFGPPGVGKTTFALQVTSNALHSHNPESHVLWVNTGSPLIEKRLQEIMEDRTSSDNDHPPSSSSRPYDIESLLEEKFVYLQAHTLPRLLTLFLHPSPSLPSSKTCLMVVDDLSNLLLGSFSRSPGTMKPGIPAAVKEKLEKKIARRRYQIIETLAAAMSKMAVLRSVAILVLTNSTMSLKNGQKATLKSALASQSWDTTVHTRIMLYRDFADDEHEAEISKRGGGGLRYAEVQRLARKNVYTTPVPFVISTGGLHQLSLDNSTSNHEPADESNGSQGLAPVDSDLPLLPVELPQHSKSKKRKAVEIAESEDEDDDGDDGDDPRSDIDEPQLPKLGARERGASEGHDEMILDTHEMVLLRSYRYASIRGSEDAVPLQLSSSDGEEERETEYRGKDADDDGDGARLP
ncbi:uncharacterized protein Z518_08127 [Rhinocladiella mackenziei CBS 650.93]|uniref:Rhinocladiella mackenziei CBS 650.93 unplaced genomic scaffold supercont1.6, whole genome shotgun sequence n=1 Tax=Rhinocladiella mackenziei CBS 650.93 TaxID=1442369 RepID=A0A0D2GV77_9EURO|nr:uncharacterized protein Z518_08127 [Rhinocladiella mackenziei CBS 650.93]KIX02188.1 hypothetical protein Z518_08127 [Rhinocladiella mackenziei CBS 650.93]